MRMIGNLVALVMIGIGSIWVLQGENLAFRVGFMVGDRHWTLYGALLALAGLGVLVWSNSGARRR
jgi:hypothetical protein